MQCLHRQDISLCDLGAGETPAPSLSPSGTGKGGAVSGYSDYVGGLASSVGGVFSNNAWAAPAGFAARTPPKLEAKASMAVSPTLPRYYAKNTPNSQSDRVSRFRIQRARSF